MTKLITFDQVSADGTINFSIGQPSADLLPLDIIQSASDHFFKHAVPQDINYGPSKGDERFLNTLANFLTERYGKPADVESLFVTCGNSQALDFVCSMFSKPGDTIFVEEPSYFLATQIFRDNHLHIVGIPTDENGLDVDRLEAELKNTKPSLLYTIPVFHNPGGQTLSAERRKRLIELSKQYGFLIVADEVYQMLNYYEQPPDAFGTMIDSDTVLSLGSFSKILAPGMRLGWIQASHQLIDRLSLSGFINSGGSVNQFTSQIVKSAIDLGLLNTHLEKIRNIYRSRLEAMDTALNEIFGDVATWIHPDGGYFFWIKLNDDIDTDKLKQVALEHKTGFQHGGLFSSGGNFKNYLRLSFASYNESDIKEGIARLKPVFGL